LTPEQLAPYVRPSYIGEHKLGLKKQDVLMLTGIIKDTEKTTIDARKSKPETGDIRESEEQEDLLLITKGSAVKKPIKEPLTSVNNSVSVKKPIMIPAVASKESVAVHETVESPELHMAKTIENEIDSLVKKLNTATSEAEKRVIDNDLDQRFAWLDSHKNVFSEISPVTINNLKKWQKKTTNRIKRLEEKLRTANNLAEITLLKAELEKYSSWRYYHQEQLCKGN
jgi:hypothetical protein